MADLPHPWDAYLRLQAQLDRSTQIDERNWGLERAVRDVVEIRCGAISGNMKVSFQAARSIG
jgi:hypothetical protein